MTDQLSALLARTADDWCRDAQPPPLPRGLPTRQPEHSSGRRLGRRLAPVLAAAAVVAAVVPTAVIARRSPAAHPISQVGQPVPVEQGPDLRFRENDAGLPPF